jgi:hypothetical protein
VGLTPLTLELNPGRHRYRLALPGHAVAESSFELRIDRSLDVRAELHPLDEARSAPPEAPPPVASARQRADAETSAAIGPFTWLSLGAGALLMGGALTFELRRAQQDQALGRASQAEYQDRYDTMAAQQTTARVLAGLGAAALVCGGTLLVLDLSRNDAGPEVAVGGCGEEALCLGASGAF